MANLNQRQANDEIVRLSRQLIELKNNSISKEEAENILVETALNAAKSVLNTCIEITRSAESCTEAIKNMKETFSIVEDPLTKD